MNTQIKFTTAAEAVKVIKSGDHNHLSSVASAPQCLIKAMCEREDLRYVSDLKMGAHDEAVEKLGGRYVFTPKKMGAQTAEANINAGLAAARQIVAFFKDGVTTCQVNK